MRYPLVAIAVVAFHLAPLLDGCESRVTKPKPVSVSIPRPEIEFVRRDINMDGAVIDACPEFYIGFGFKHGFTGHVSDIAPGGPAERAGMLPNDVVDTSVIPWPMEVGFHIVLTVIRGSGTARIEMTAEKICTTKSG